MADIKNQADLDAIYKLAIANKDKAAIKTLKKLLEGGEIHFPKGSQKPVFGAAPKVEEAAAAVEKLSEGPAAKKGMTDADRAEMAAAEERAKKAAAAQKAADQKALEELQAQRAADEAKKAAAAPAPEEPEAPKAEEPKAPTAKKNAPKKETKAPVARTGKSTPGTVPVRTRETSVEQSPKLAPRVEKPGVAVEAPSRQEQQAKMEAMKRGAKRTPTVEGIAKKTLKDVEIVDAVDTEGNKIYNEAAEEVKQLKQKGLSEDRLKALRAQNFKEEWGRSTAEVQNRILRNTFGEKALSLPTATRNKLGELAMASEAFKQSGLTSLPNMDDNLKRLETIKDQLKATTVPKGIDVQISNAHSSLITATGGKIRTDKLEFRKPRPGEVGSDKPKPENPVQKVSPGFETAKRAQVPVEARNLAAAAKKKPMDAGAPAAAAAAEETPAVPSGKKPMDAGISEPVPSTPTGKRPMDAGPAPSAATPAAEATKSPYMQTVLADPVKYGAQKDRATWTKEQRAARKALAEELGLNTPEARAAKKAAEAAADPELAEVKKRYGEAVRSNPTKYGRSNKKATDAQKAAKRELFSKLTEQVKAEGAARTPAVPTTARAPTVPPGPPTAPATPAGAPAAPVPPAAIQAQRLQQMLGPTAGAAPAPTSAAAPAAAAAPKAAAGPWKKGAMRSGIGAAKGTKAVKQRLAAMTGGGAGVGGAMRFLGPLLGAFAAYQLLDLAKQGTVDAADERRLRALQALGAVGQGAQEDLAGREQVRQMQRMVDMAAIQRQQQLDEMSQQYTRDRAMNSLINANQASLAALAQPSRPSIAEMMARFG